MRGVLILVFLLVATMPGPTSAAATAYRWPLAPRPSVVRGFDPPAEHWLAGHRGVDLGATVGAAVLASRSGTVQFAGTVSDRSLVSIRHGDGIVTTYEPITPRVARGDHVVGGSVIGVLVAGHAGCRVAACLHWGARRGVGHDAAYLNPLGLLGLLRVRLKPLTPEDVPDRAPLAVARR